MKQEIESEEIRFDHEGEVENAGVVGEDIPNAFHEAAVMAQDFYRKVFMVLTDFKGPKGFAVDCACLALGWKDIVGVNSQEELAQRYAKVGNTSCTKANVNKLVCEIQSLCEIPPMIGQRDASARNAMTKARDKQLE